MNFPSEKQGHLCMSLLILSQDRPFFLSINPMKPYLYHVRIVRPKKMIDVAKNNEQNPR